MGILFLKGRGAGAKTKAKEEIKTRLGYGTAHWGIPDIPSFSLSWSPHIGTFLHFYVLYKLSILLCTRIRDSSYSPLHHQKKDLIVDHKNDALLCRFNRRSQAAS